MLKEDTYLVLEEAKFMWTYEEILQIREYHKEQKDVFEIAKLMNEDPEDVALVIFDQVQKGKLEEASK